MTLAGLATPYIEVMEQAARASGEWIAQSTDPIETRSNDGQRTLRRRLVGLLLRWFVVFLAVSLLVGGWMLAQVRSWMSEGHRLLAETVAEYVDATLSDALRDLERVSSELGRLDEGARPRLRSARLRNTFNHAIHIVDQEGRLLISDPPHARPPEREWQQSVRGRTGIQFRAEGAAALMALQTFSRGGKNYQLIAEAQPTGSGLSAILHDLASDPSLHIVIVDAAARVIAAPDQHHLSLRLHTIPRLTERIRARRPLVTESTHCPLCAYRGAFEGRNLTVMIPLDVAPWAIVVQQHEPTILSLAETFMVGFVSVTLILGVLGALLSRSFSRSVIEPIQSLSRQAERLREGDLDTPIRTDGDREMHLLAESLDDARKRVGESMSELRLLNEDLEKVVGQRTDELRRRIEDLRMLLDLSNLSSHESPAIFIPRALELLSSKFDLSSIALVMAGNEPSVRRVHTLSDMQPPTWLLRNEPPPASFTRRELVHLGILQGELLFEETTALDQPLFDAVCSEIAAALYSTSLLERLLDHDARRRELVRRLLRAGEEERLRIARELHDEISQLLTAVQISIEQVMVPDPERFAHTRNLLQRTQKEIHRIIHDLRPSILDDLGLAAAVKWYAQRDLASRGIEVRLEVEDELALPGEIEITLFRILQESITNILRHAAAQSVYIELFRTSDRLVLIVEDDGVGFDSSARMDRAGLMGMRERAELVGGRIRIDSELDHGTTVHLVIPLEEKR